MVSKKILLIWVVIAILASIFFSLEILGDQITTDLFDRGDFELLNKVSGAKENQPLGFYVGHVENEVFGPIKSLTSGMLFLIFALFYLQGASMRKFGLAIFVFLLIFKFKILFYPPYGEAVNGPFFDVLWFLEKSFNFTAFVGNCKEGLCMLPVYPLSCFPFLLFILIKILPTIQMFVIVMHILIFGMSAVICALVYGISLRVWDRKTAIFCSLLVLFNPIFQCMSELMNMEMTMLFFAMLSIYFLSQRKFASASIMATMSLLVKLPGAVVCTVLLCVSGIIIISDLKQKNKIMNIVYVIIPVAIAIIKKTLRTQVREVNVFRTKVQPWIGWNNIKELFTFKIVVVAVVIFLISSILFMLKNKEKGRFKKFIEKNLPIIAMLVMAFGWFAMQLHFEDLAPRYKLLNRPFVAFTFVYFVSVLLPQERVRSYLLILFIGVSMLASHGIFYSEACVRPTNLERSLEYRNYMRVQMEITKEIEEKYTGYTIGAPLHFAQIIAYPELGHVKVPPKDVILYGYEIPLKGCREFKGIKFENILKTIWVGYEYDKKKGVPGYPYGKNDRVLKKIRYGDVEVVLFMGGIGIEKMRIIFDHYKKKAYNS